MAKTLRMMVQALVRTSFIKGPPCTPMLTTASSSSLLPCWSCGYRSEASQPQTRKIHTSSEAYKKIDKINSSDFLHDRNSLGLSNKLFGKYEKVSLGEVSKPHDVPETIKRPDYCFRADGTPAKPVPKKPGIKTVEEIDLMRESCCLAKFVLDRTLGAVKAGLTTAQLNDYAHQLIIDNKAYPSALGYRKFPKSICTSVNNVACHGIPDSRKLINGDIISVDVMVYKNGFHGDCAGTTLVGTVDELGQKLVRVAEECTAAGISVCGPDVPFENIGKAIEAHANSEGLSVVPMFTGHGIGRNVHEKPDIYHYDRQEGSKELMKAGMIFTVEPVITQGMDLVMVLSDGWTAVTVDGARTAQFEDTILITKDGFEILTDSSLALILS